MAADARPSLRRESERVRQIWERFAPRYDRQVSFWERTLFAGGREWVCSRASGSVLEIAVGTGRNLPFYPADVRITGVEFSPSMLELAKRRAARLGRVVNLRLGDAQSLSFEDASFDTVVSTLAMCSIPDHRRATAEAARVLRPGGLMVLLEHVRSPLPLVRGVQRLLDPLAVRFVGDHLLREPLGVLRAAGFELLEVERLKWGIVERVTARKPELGGQRR